MANVSILIVWHSRMMLLGNVLIVRLGMLCGRRRRVGGRYVCLIFRMRIVLGLMLMYVSIVRMATLLIKMEDVKYCRKTVLKRHASIVKNGIFQSIINV